MLNRLFRIGVRGALPVSGVAAGLWCEPLVMIGVLKPSIEPEARTDRIYLVFSEFVERGLLLQAQRPAPVSA